jgi:hypothetical protein
MRIAKMFVAFTVTALMLAACANQKEPAEKAVAQVESSLAEFRADAEKYAADELKSVDEAVAKLKANLEKEGLQRRRDRRALGVFRRDFAQGHRRKGEDRRGSGRRCGASRVG